MSKKRVMAMLLVLVMLLPQAAMAIAPENPAGAPRAESRETVNPPAKQESEGAEEVLEDGLMLSPQAQPRAVRSEDQQSYIKPLVPTVCYIFKQDGKELGRQYLENNDKLFQPAIPTKEGVEFEGWYDAKGNKFENFNNAIPVDDNNKGKEIVLNARFKSEFQVIFMERDKKDSRIFATKGGPTGTVITTTDVKAPTLTPSVFEGWKFEDGTPAPDEITLEKKNITLYPRMTPGHYLKFVTGTPESYQSPLFVKAGENTWKPEDPARKGYEFQHWSTEENGPTAYEFGKPITADTTLYAVWKEIGNHYTIVYHRQSLKDKWDTPDAEKTYDVVRKQEIHEHIAGPNKGKPVHAGDDIFLPKEVDDIDITRLNKFGENPNGDPKNKIDPKLLKPTTWLPYFTIWDEESGFQNENMGWQPVKDYIPELGEYNIFFPFAFCHYNEAKTGITSTVSEAQKTTVAADGSTELHVYYDRDVLELNLTYRDGTVKNLKGLYYQKIEDLVGGEPEVRVDEDGNPVKQPLSWKIVALKTEVKYKDPAVGKKKEEERAKLIKKRDDENAKAVEFEKAKNEAIAAREKAKADKLVAEGNLHVAEQAHNQADIKKYTEEVKKHQAEIEKQKKLEEENEKQQREHEFQARERQREADKIVTSQSYTDSFKNNESYRIFGYRRRLDFHEFINRSITHNPGKEDEYTITQTFADSKDGYHYNVLNPVQATKEEQAGNEDVETDVGVFMYYQNADGTYPDEMGEPPIWLASTSRTFAWGAGTRSDPRKPHYLHAAVYFMTPENFQYPGRRLLPTKAPVNDESSPKYKENYDKWQVYERDYSIQVRTGYNVFLRYRRRQFPLTLMNWTGAKDGKPVDFAQDQKLNVRHGDVFKYRPETRPDGIPDDFIFLGWCYDKELTRDVNVLKGTIPRLDPIKDRDQITSAMPFDYYNRVRELPESEKGLVNVMPTAPLTLYAKWGLPQVRVRIFRDGKFFGSFEKTFGTVMNEAELPTVRSADDTIVSSGTSAANRSGSRSRTLDLKGNPTQEAKYAYGEIKLRPDEIWDGWQKDILARNDDNDPNNPPKLVKYQFGEKLTEDIDLYATTVPNTGYKLTYKYLGQDGKPKTHVDEKNYAPGTDARVQPPFKDMTKDKIFAGWYLWRCGDCDNQAQCPARRKEFYAPNQMIKMTGNLTLEPLWGKKPRTATVIYDGNGGKLFDGSTRVEIPEVYDKSNHKVRPNKEVWSLGFELEDAVLIGWKYTYKGKEYVVKPGDEVTVVADDDPNGTEGRNVLTAIWKYKEPKKKKKPQKGNPVIEVTKLWEDNGNRDMKRPEFVEVKLLANGEDTGRTLKLYAENNWSGRIGGLDVQKDGKDIVYTVKEMNVAEGYTSTVTGDPSTGFTITNTYKDQEVRPIIPRMKRVVIPVKRIPRAGVGCQ